MRKLGKAGILMMLVFFWVFVHGATSAGAFIYPDRITMVKGLAHYAMGYMYDLRGLTNQAILEYEMASRFDDASYLIRLRLGTNYARLHLLPQSIHELRRVQDLNPQDLQSHYLLALIYSDQKNFDKVAEEYEAILSKISSKQPENIEIYGYLGKLYYIQQKYTQAIEQFEKILNVETENTAVMSLLGSLYIEVRQEDQAEMILKKSLSLDPNQDDGLNALAYLYAEQGRNLEEAEVMVRKALELSPGHGAYWDTLGWIYYQKQEYDKALLYLEKADHVLDDPVILEHLGDVHLKLNNFDKAEEYWKRALHLQPGLESVIEKINNLDQRQASHQTVK
jgi:Tfp pilus assembly protein PilF